MLGLFSVRRCTALLLCLLAGGAHAQDAAWSLRLQPEQQVAYRGMASFDSAGGGTASFLYPAPNLVGFLAAVLTHNAVVESTKNSEKARLQQQADKVLEPYQPALAEWTQRALMERALSLLPASGVRQLIEPESLPAEGGHIDAVPVFTMTQDRRALVLDVAVALHAPGAAAGGDALYRNAIRVVSAPRPEEDLVSFWGAEGAEKLKGESAALLAESLRIALAQSSAGAASSVQQKTYRYPEGGSEKIERAEMVGQSCDRWVLKTLRGWLLSVPRPDAAGACERTAVAQ